MLNFLQCRRLVLEQRIVPARAPAVAPPGLASANVHPWLSFLLLVDFLPQWKDGCFCRCGLPPDALTTNSTS